MLVSLAGQVNVGIPGNDAELLVENSDHTLRTLIINVDRARRHEVPLNGRLGCPARETPGRLASARREAGIPLRPRFLRACT